MNTNHNDNCENLIPLCLSHGGNIMQWQWGELRVSRLFKKLVHLIAQLMISSFVMLTPIASSYGFDLPRKELAFYLQFSLSNTNRAIRKIIKTGPLAVQGVCKSSSSGQCSKSILNKKVNAAFGGNGRIKIRGTSKNPDLKFVFLSASDLANQKLELLELYRNSFNDSDDPECQLYYSIKENVIERIVIVVSLDSPELKQRFCLASQLFQGLGLSLQNDLPFSKLWKEAPNGLPNGQRKFTLDDVSKLTKGYAVLSYIHMCPDIKPGMTADDINRLLLGNSVCLDGLEFLPEKTK
jgi:hypothetical protein